MIQTLIFDGMENYQHMKYCLLPTAMGNYRMYDSGNDSIRLISYGDIYNLGENPLVRIQSSCLASEIFGAIDCDCADQLRESMKMIATEDAGLVIHLDQEGRGQGLSNKINVVRIMQHEKVDTAEAFNYMRLEQDIRQYNTVTKLLTDIGYTKIRLISNNPRKINAVEHAGIKVESINTNPNIRPENKDYLYCKNIKLGHQLPLDRYEDINMPIHFYHSDQPWGEFSNFSPHPVFLKGLIWNTVEHYYQAQKFKGMGLESKIRMAKSPSKAKEIARLNMDKYNKNKWSNIKENTMLEALFAKFTQHPQLRTKLLDTKDRYIAEHTSNDLYWGDGLDGSGKNRLGELIMNVRYTLKK